VQVIRTVEWLTMVPDTAVDALVAANDIGRYFLCESMSRFATRDACPHRRMSS
jgi:hypothetical protein